MAKGRMIHTRIWRSETLCAYGLRERLLWIGLVTNADDQGRGRAHPGLVRSDVFPLEDVPLDEITTALAAFADDGMLILYDSDGKQLYQVANWWDYQGSMTWAWPSDFPPPDGWTDRIRYRKGNTVAEENWQGDGGMDDAPPDESEPTASPPRDHNEPEPKRAPNGNGNSNGNGTTVREAGAGAPPSTFAEWSDAILKSKNRQAVIRTMCETLYPGLDPPDFSYIARVARTVGGAGRLADLLWQHSTRPPTGDLLAYIQGVAKNEKRGRDNGRHSQEDVGLSEESKAIAAALAGDDTAGGGEGTGPPL